jgi:hypothetical protein
MSTRPVEKVRMRMLDDLFDVAASDKAERRARAEALSGGAT